MAALEVARSRCSSFLGDLEALARRVRPNPAGPIWEAGLTASQWDALNELDDAVTWATDLDVPVDDSVWQLLEAAGYEDAANGGSDYSLSSEREGPYPVE